MDTLSNIEPDSTDILRRHKGIGASMFIVFETNFWYISALMKMFIFKRIISSYYLTALFVLFIV